MLLAIPKASGGDHGNQYTGGKNRDESNFAKSKSETITDMGRRNLTLSELVAAQESVAKDLEAEAKERLSPGTNQYTDWSRVNLPTTSQSRVSEQMAKKIGVSEKTYRDARIV